MDGEKEKVLGGLIGLIYEAAANTDLWSIFLAECKDLFHSTASVAAFYHPGSRRGRIWQASGTEPQWIFAYDQHFASVNVWLREASQYYCLPGIVRTSEQDVPNRELVRTEFYNDFLRPQSLFHRVCGCVTWERGEMFHVSFARPRKEGPYTETEVAQFRELIPHLQRAVDLHRFVIAVQDERDTLKMALDVLPVGVVGLDGDAKVCSVNRRAEEVLARSDGLTIASDRLQPALRRERGLFEARVREAAKSPANRGDGAGIALSVSRPSGQPPLSLRVIPVSSRNRFLGQPQSCAAICFISDPDHRPRAHEETLRRLYLLTPAEARLASLIAQGCPLRESAEMLKITTGTARNHLKRIFDKTGVHRQCDLVRVLVSGPAQIHSDAGSDTSDPARVSAR